MALISSGLFSRLVGISPRRFDQRRLRERSAADIAGSMGDDEIVPMPIAPSGPYSHARYDALDATRLRAVVRLEAAGTSFAAACQLLRGVGPEVMWPSGADILAASWLEPSGVLRRIVGTRQDIGRAAPEGPLALISVNVSAVRDEVAQRAATQLGLRVDGLHFVKDPKG